MASNPRPPTASEGPISVDEAQRRVFAFIYTQLALSGDSMTDYFVYFDVPNPIPGVPDEEIESFVREFALTQLARFPEARRRRAVEIFASAMPAHLTVDIQADLGTIFEAGLREVQLPQTLSDIFFEYLPEAVELRTPTSPMEFEPVPMFLEDVLVPLPRIFPWFEPSTIVVRDPPEPIIPLLGPGVPQFAILNDFFDLTIDLRKFRLDLTEYNMQISQMVDDIGASDDPMRANAQRLVYEIADDLSMVLLPEVRNISEDNIAVMTEGLGNAEKWLATAKEKLFLAEAYLITQEAVLLSSGGKAKGQASRYERSRYRDYIKWGISTMRTPRLRQLFIPSIPQPSPTVRKYDESESTCPICIQDLPEEGEICPPAAVLFTCCKKGLHTDCLLGWMIDKIGRDSVPCPMCREPLDLAFFGEILEQKVRELQVL